MGLAASQARLLLLTARKTDLEYRAQMITQRKMLLAMQTEELATSYSKSLNDRKLYFTYSALNNQNATQETLLTYNDLTSASNVQRYRVIDSATGQVVALSEADFAKYTNMLAGTQTTPQTTANGTTTVGTPTFAPSESITPNYNWANILRNDEAFQNALQSGALLIQELHTDAGPNGEADANGNPTSTSIIRTWHTVTLSGMDDVRSKLYTENDAAATANYEYQSLILQNADKQLDVELKQIETQQKACENEIDSVKKILDKNIEKSFKTFA